MPQKRLHKRLTCPPLRRRMQHLDLPTNIVYKITRDHKIFRLVLEANVLVLEERDDRD